MKHTTILYPISDPMKKTTKAGKPQPKVFTCDVCNTEYESDEYKTSKGWTFDGGKYVNTITYTDKCPECKAKNVIRE